MMPSNIINLFKKYREVILYLFFGGCTTLINIVAYYLCDKVGLGTTLSTVAAWVLSVLFAYVTNRRFVFESRARGAAIFKEGVQFFSCRLFTGILDLGVMLLFVSILEYNGLLIKILSNVLVIVLNYVLSKLVIFKDKAEESSLKKGGLHSIFHSLPALAVTMFSIYIGVSLLFNVVIDRQLSLYYQPNRLETSSVLILFGACVLVMAAVALVAFFSGRGSTDERRRLSDRQFYAAIAACFAGVFLVQLFISSKIWFKTDWDVRTIVINAEDIAYGRADGVTFTEYFSMYPNNMVLVYTVALLLKIGKTLSVQDPYTFVLKVNAFVVCLSVFLSVLCVYKLTRRRALTLVGMAAGIGLIAFSPWIVIPYSDTFGMIFPIAAIFCCVFMDNIYAKCFAVALFSCVGYLYKPTIIIVLIAFVLLLLLDAIRRLVEHQASLKHGVGAVLAIVLAAGIAAGINTGVNSLNKTELDPNKQMTMTHYLMMGLNPETEGVFSADDVYFSLDCSTVAERQAENLRVVKERLTTTEKKELIKHMIKKNLNNYDSGSFAWGREGMFVIDHEQRSGRAAAALWDFYWQKSDQNFQLFAQILWFAVLICICFCMVGNKSNTEVLISLTLIGVSLFLLLFESRARYLYVFSPLFVILAAGGLQKLCGLIENFAKSNKTHTGEQQKVSDENA